MKGVLPSISDTERTALEAGVVWVEKDLFSGKPNFKKLKEEPYPSLTAEEKAFLDGPTEKLCKMINDWEIWQSREVPQDVWDFIKKERFLGMIIPKEHGGLGFSALAHGAVVEKLSSRSIPVGVTVMVPNSLGPAELLLHYGTQDQKKRLLPKLAVGEEIPCFGLTEPNAGSDAGSITSYGVLFKGEDGKLKLRIDWNKRWITLAAISTTIGLAIQVKDPDGLLGDEEDLGITCVLVPSKTPGVVIGHRHDPLGVPFYNCPTQGKDVVVDVEDCVVGGQNGLGKGWGMLMDCLGAGRGISLPSQSTGGGKIAFLAASGHSVVRKQFGLSIGKFEGVEEPLALIGGLSYMIESCRNFTAGALDRGIAPPVVTAIAKYQTTEAYRKIINSAMDIVGGAAISKGPRNTLAHGYIGAPISITVEGANILTRTLMVFGQGALRAHPYAYAEVKAAEASDVKAFDKAFWSHVGHVVRNLFRSILLSWTRGYLSVGFSGGPMNTYYRKLSWASASFAIMSDIAMGSLGGSLKVKEKLTGRYADILSWMYLSLSIIRRYEATGKKEDLVLAQYALEYGMNEIQRSFVGIFDNLKVPGLTWLFKGVIGRWARFNSFGRGPSDDLGHKVCELMMTDGEQRERLTDGVYKPDADEPGLGQIQRAFELSKKAEAFDSKVKKAMRKKQISKKPILLALDEALEKGIITSEENDCIAEAGKARWETIQVDDFDQDGYVRYGSKSFTTGL
jgi:acyl-CoA dehydrogenase